MAGYLRFNSCINFSTMEGYFKALKQSKGLMAEVLDLDDDGIMSDLDIDKKNLPPTSEIGTLYDPRQRHRWHHSDFSK